MSCPPGKRPSCAASCNGGYRRGAAHPGGPYLSGTGQVHRQRQHDGRARTRLDCRASDRGRGRGVRARRPRPPDRLRRIPAHAGRPGRGRAHCDYKRWRPVGSSMNWAFAIIPLNDFDAEYGPFLVSPKSHRLAQVIDPQARVLDLTAPDARATATVHRPGAEGRRPAGGQRARLARSTSGHHQRGPLRQFFTSTVLQMHRRRPDTILTILPRSTR